MTKAALTYEPHIDGIRAIAVISVLIFHFEFNFITSGFVGVDMFFVISGFLITRLLLKEVNTGSFDFKRFYLRRILRLAPALFAVLVVSFVVASIFLTPVHFQRFGGAFLSSVFSVSNIYFLSEAGYFDATATLKPLLHTWSLSVEEQFYLLWPALLYFLRGRSVRTIGLLFLAMGLTSLVATMIATNTFPSASFFLMPFRIYEFAIGAILAIMPLSALRQWRLAEIASLLGFGCVVASVLVFTKATPFPSYNALLPCMAAALLIVFGTARMSGFLLRNRFSVYVGKISYSLYLVHWPVIVLYKHITFEDVVVGKTRIALILLTIVLAMLLHHLIENRFRNWKSTNSGSYIQTRQLVLWLSAPVIVMMASVHAYATDGWSGRFNAEVINAIGDVSAKQLQRRKYIEGANPLSNLPFDESANIKLLVMGDSHATDGFNALHSANPYPERVSVRRLEIDDVCFNLFTPDSISTEVPHVQARCKEHFEFLTKSPLLDEADWVVISTRWEVGSFDYLPAFVQYVRDRGNRVMVLGRTGEYKSVPSLVLKHGLDSQTPTILASSRDKSLDVLNHKLRSVSLALGVVYLDKLPWLCDVGKNKCDVIDKNGLILYTDYGHWSMEGARYFGERAWSDSKFNQLVLE